MEQKMWWPLSYHKPSFSQWPVVQRGVCCFSFLSSTLILTNTGYHSTRYFPSFFLDKKILTYLNVGRLIPHLMGTCYQVKGEVLWRVSGKKLFSLIRKKILKEKVLFYVLQLLVPCIGDWGYVGREWLYGSWGSCVGLFRWRPRDSTLFLA